MPIGMSEQPPVDDHAVLGQNRHVANPTWEELEAAVPFQVLVPELLDGWVCQPRAIAPGVVLLSVYDSDGTLKLSIQESATQVQRSEPERETQEVDGLRSHWRVDFADRNPITNVVATLGDVEVCVVGKLAPADLGRVLAGLRPRG